MSLRNLIKERDDLRKRIEDFDFDWQADYRSTDMLEEYLSEMVDMVVILGMTYNPIEVLRQIDHTAYREVMNNEVDSLLDDRDDNEGILRDMFSDYDTLFHEVDEIDKRIGEITRLAMTSCSDDGKHPEYGHLIYCEIESADDAPGFYYLTSPSYPGKKSRLLTDEDLDGLGLDLDYHDMPFGYVNDEVTDALFGDSEQV